MSLSSRLRVTAAVATAFLCASVATSLTQEINCPQQVASNKLEFRADKKGTNVGVVPSGFVNPSDGTKVVHGIDVSKYQDDANLAAIRKCGGAFVYVRLSAGTKLDNELAYRAIWANAKSFGLLTGPYHHLTLADSKLPFSQLSPPDADAIISKNVQQASLQADNFKKRLVELLEYDPIDRREGLRLGGSYLPAALDISEVPQSRFTLKDQSLFGRAYGAAVCGWIKAFREDPKFKDQPVILFTKAFIYRDFDLLNAPCDLKSFRVWLWYHGTTGDGARTERNPIYRQAISDLCVDANRNNRCLFEQYTSYGGFAIFNKKAGLDLDRFSGSVESLHALLQNLKTQ
jgi:GH25 family lysozyme M1 (1,4-beta-N-acetylmuramidase)